MNKLMIAITVVLFTSKAFALEVQTNWSAASEKSLSLTCGENSACEQFCEAASCEVPEKVCKNCVSTSIAMTFAFKEMGRAIVAKEQTDAYALFDLLESGEFVSLTSRSIYNIIERFNSSALKRRFRSLCNDGTEYPHAFFETGRSGEIGTPRMVWCDSGVYQLERLSELPVADSLESQLF